MLDGLDEIVGADTSAEHFIWQRSPRFPGLQQILVVDQGSFRDIYRYIAHYLDCNSRGAKRQWCFGRILPICRDFIHPLRCQQLDIEVGISKTVPAIGISISASAARIEPSAIFWSAPPTTGIAIDVRSCIGSMRQRALGCAPPTTRIATSTSMGLQLQLAVA